MIDFITGFNLLPATGEFGYDPLPYRASRWPPSAADRQFKPINTYAAPGSGRTDYSLALDALAEQEGELGRRKITQYTRYSTIFLSIVQAFGIALFGIPLQAAFYLIRALQGWLSKVTVRRQELGK